MSAILMAIIIHVKAMKKVVTEDVHHPKQWKANFMNKEKSYNYRFFLNACLGINLGKPFIGAEELEKGLTHLTRCCGSHFF